MALVIRLFVIIGLLEPISISSYGQASSFNRIPHRGLSKWSSVGPRPNWSHSTPVNKILNPWHSSGKNHRSPLPGKINDNKLRAPLGPSRWNRERRQNGWDHFHGPHHPWGSHPSERDGWNQEGHPWPHSTRVYPNEWPHGRRYPAMSQWLRHGTSNGPWGGFPHDMPFDGTGPTRFNSMPPDPEHPPSFVEPPAPTINFQLPPPTRQTLIANFPSIKPSGPSLRQIIEEAEIATHQIFDPSPFVAQMIHQRLDMMHSLKRMLFEAAGIGSQVIAPDDGTFWADMLLTDDQTSYLMSRLNTFSRRKRYSIFLEGFPAYRWDVAAPIPYSFDANVGVNHHHQRNDRDKYIRINWENIDPTKYDYFAVADTTIFTTYGVPYDYYSIMSYSPRVGTLPPYNRPSVTALQGQYQAFLGQRRFISNGDAELLNRMYCKPPSCVDRNIYCGAWANLNLCQRPPQYGWMIENCRKSCGFC